MRTYLLLLSLTLLLSRTLSAKLDYKSLDEASDLEQAGERLKIAGTPRQDKVKVADESLWTEGDDMAAGGLPSHVGFKNDKGSNGRNSERRRHKRAVRSYTCCTWWSGGPCCPPG